MSSDLEFEKTNLRTKDVPQNQRLNAIEWERTYVDLEFDKQRIAYFTRMCTWLDIFEPIDDAEFAKVIKETQAGRILSAGIRYDFAFKIRASRLVMDQLLRDQAKAGAQTTRDNDFRNFNLNIPPTIAALKDASGPHGENWEGLYGEFMDAVENLRDLYGQLVDTGRVPPQDARCILPLGSETQWVWPMDLYEFQKICERRMCNGLIQPETDYVVRLMRDAYVRHEPWTDPMLRSSCEKKGKCTGGGMLFPACGAFIDGIPLDRPDTEENVRFHVSKYDPDRHLFPKELNSAQRFAEFDIKRQGFERRWVEENPDDPQMPIWPMAVEPDFDHPIAWRAK